MVGSYINGLPGALMQGLVNTFSQTAADQAVAGGRSAASDAARDFQTLLTQSKLALNGLLLALVGFFGIFGIATLHLQAAIISAYVLIFGVMLLCFAAGWNNEVLHKYFGFIYRPGGQLIFLLIAGNLAWSTGLLGVLVAVFTNFTAVGHWYTAGSAEAQLPVPSWMAPRSTSQQYDGSNATGMVDVRRDELL